MGFSWVEIANTCTSFQDVKSGTFLEQPERGMIDRLHPEQSSLWQELEELGQPNTRQGPRPASICV